MVGNDLKKEYKINSGYILRKIAGESLLVAVDNMEKTGSKIMMLNETGCFIWNNLENYSTIEALVAKAKNEFNDIEGVLDQDIYEFVKSMVAMGLIDERCL